MGPNAANFFSMTSNFFSTVEISSLTKTRVISLMLEIPVLSINVDGSSVTSSNKLLFISFLTDGKFIIILCVFSNNSYLVIKSLKIVFTPLLITFSISDINGCVLKQSIFSSLILWTLILWILNILLFV